MEYPTEVIDVHTHLFNSRYLPLKGIVAEALPDKWKFLAPLLQRLFWAITGASVSESHSLVSQSKIFSSDAEAFYTECIWRVVEGQLAGRIQGIARQSRTLRTLEKDQDEFFRENLKTDELQKLVQEIKDVVERVERDPDLITDPDLRLSLQEIPEDTALAGPRGITDIRALSLTGKYREPVSKFLKLIAKLAKPSFWSEVGGFIQFFFTMLASEREIFSSLKAGYGTQPFKISFVHFMMDMQYAYQPSDAAYYDMYTAMANMKELELEVEGAITGFSAFDPRNPQRDKIFEKALEMGFAGMKFYPPMGYMAIDNPDPAVEAAVEDFFLKCVKRDIPVFAHCTPKGFESKEGSGANSDPEIWRKRLAKDGFDKLRLCLGHAGGESWLRKDKEWGSPGNYAATVIELCRSYPNVYCEVGHLHGILESRDNAEWFKENLGRGFLIGNENAPFHFAGKIMYGSDWHMPAMINDTDDYLRFFVEMFNEEPFRPYREQFFHLTAKEFLRKNSAQARTATTIMAPFGLRTLALARRRIPA